MKYLFSLTAFVILLASASLSVTAKAFHAAPKPMKSFAGAIRIANGKLRNPGATKRTEGKTRVPLMRASFTARPTSAIGTGCLVSAEQNQENSKTPADETRRSRRDRVVKREMTEQELIALVADAIEDADSHLCSEGGKPPYEKMAVAAIEAIRSAISEKNLRQTR